VGLLPPRPESALTPLMSQFGIDLAAVSWRVVVVEVVFGIPGLGHQLITAVGYRGPADDSGHRPTHLRLRVIANLVVDLLYAVIDPRVHITPNQVLSAAHWTRAGASATHGRRSRQRRLPVCGSHPAHRRPPRLQRGLVQLVPPLLRDQPAPAPHLPAVRKHPGGLEQSAQHDHVSLPSPTQSIGNGVLAIGMIWTPLPAQSASTRSAL